MDKKNQIEFIDSKIEREEITGFSIKAIIDGSLLTLSHVVRQIPFILFLVGLAILYIANRYHAEKMFRQIDQMKNEVRDLRAEQITITSELMNLSKPSRVQELIEDNNMEFSESTEPPFIIIKKK